MAEAPLSSDSRASLARAVELLRAGEAIGLPTETVYGLAADALRADATARIFAIKRRPTNHPLIVHLADASELDRYAAHVPETARRLAERFWPGPLTLLLARGERVPLSTTGGLDTVALRVPAHPLALEVLRAFARPLAAPSANRFGSVSPTTRQHVVDDLGDDVPLVLDGGPCTIGLESTIVDLTRDLPRLVRPGAITRSTLEATLGTPVLDADGSERAPGTLPSHYAPRAAVRLVESSELFREVTRTAVRPLGVIAESPPPRDFGPDVRVEVVADGASFAHELYAALRRFDERGARLILSSLPTDEDGIGAAVADRLRRAAAPRN